MKPNKISFTNKDIYKMCNCHRCKRGKTNCCRGRTGLQGKVGVQGEIGIDGPFGQVGFEGSQGFAGESGPIGIAGEDNNQQGASGVQGFAGQKGQKGQPGTDGNVGPDGSTGPVGIDGFAGNAGLDGAQGTIGVTGNDGINGLDGIQGFNGNKGSQGASGVQGHIGIVGDVGTQGLIGLLGSAGVQGILSTIPGGIGTQGVIGAAGPGGFQILNGAQLPNYTFSIPQVVPEYEFWKFTNILDGQVITGQFIISMVDTRLGNKWINYEDQQQVINNSYSTFLFTFTIARNDKSPSTVIIPTGSVFTVTSSIVENFQGFLIGAPRLTPIINNNTEVDLLVSSYSAFLESSADGIFGSTNFAIIGFYQITSN